MHKAFEVHRLNDQGVERALRIATLFDNLRMALSPMVFDGAANRETALVMTHLELACLYAKKAMSQELANQDLAPQGSPTPHEGIPAVQP